VIENNIANMESCRNLCIAMEEPCTGYQWKTDNTLTLSNCVFFSDTSVITGNGIENYECYTVTPDSSKPLIAAEIYV